MIKVPADSLSGLQIAVFLLNLHMMERDHLSAVSSDKGTNPIMGLHSHDLIAYQRPPPNNIILRIQSSTFEFWGDTNIRSIAICN